MSSGIGDALRAAREDQGRSLEDVALSIRARSDQVRALEDERFDTFGGDVYAKGFLKSYAHELGLDPQPLLDAYRRKVSHDDATPTALIGGVGSAPKQRSAPPAYILWLLAAVVIVAGLAFLGMMGTGRAPEVASPDEPAGPPVAPAEQDEDDGDGPASEPEPEPAPEPEPEPEPEPDGVELLLAFEEASWTRIIVDGTPVLEETIDAGQTMQYRGDQEVEIRFGNPGGVRVELNGEDLGPQGARGQPVTIVYTIDGPNPT